MKPETRLQIISKMAYSLSVNNIDYFPRDVYWIIGMLADCTLSDDRLTEEVERIKRHYSDIAHFF